MLKKVWFARKQNGDVIFMNEIEALTFYEPNNISNRMKLHFLGTSDGAIYHKLMTESMSLPETQTVEGKLTYPRKEKAKEAFDKELEKAVENGVQRPDASLRIITHSGDGEATGSERAKILESMN